MCIRDSQGTEPFVELIFSENRGGNEEIYTVRRVPRYMRPKKRGDGAIQESGRLSLIMPDGTEYPQKEADAKIRSVTGLTKDQFMQVAMICLLYTSGFICINYLFRTQHSLVAGRVG